MSIIPSQDDNTEVKEPLPGESRMHGRPANNFEWKNAGVRLEGFYFFLQGTISP
jgi:hypothetical protein